MSKREAISRYALIIKKLRKAPATFKEIYNYLDQESEFQGYNFRISKRTFDRDRDDILSLYNINIRNDSHIRKYVIDSELEPEANERILEAFETFNALNISDRLSDYIHFEKRNQQGSKHLYGILYAIKNKQLISFTYQKYWEDNISERNVEPYALKEFKSRWYLLAKDLKDKNIKSFALDRITELDISKRTFKAPDVFDIKNYYRNCFGIISPNNNESPEEVILTFNPVQGKYIKSLPIHTSQKVVIDNNEEIRISLDVYPTYDFIQEILSYGDNVKVISPKTLVDGIKNEHQKALNLYN